MWKFRKIFENSDKVGVHKQSFLGLGVKIYWNFVGLKHQKSKKKRSENASKEVDFSKFSSQGKSSFLPIPPQTLVQKTYHASFSAHWNDKNQTKNGLKSRLRGSIFQRRTHSFPCTPSLRRLTPHCGCPTRISAPPFRILFTPLYIYIILQDLTHRK